MDSKTAKMQSRVAKLLRQAEDVVGTPEEAVFQAKAFELMAKYGIEMAQVEATKAGLDMTEMPDAIKWEATVSGKYVAQQALLLHGIARALHCKTVYTTIGGTKSQRVYVFGMQRHVERVQFLWDILRPQMLRLVNEVRPETMHQRTKYDWRTGEYRTVSGAGQVKSYRRAWIAGFAQTIGDRVRAEESKAVESAGGGALVLYRDDKARAQQALTKAFPRVRVTRSNTSYNSSGYAHGQRDGRNASMQRSLAS
ncbi:hypothetical protein SEA_SEMPERFI_84 [Mycobacterium phage SemperFi]|nr:hypothetical protein PBI_SWEETIEPIE_84 [Mycobacterium phage SweetiePie]YP_010063795.1 hypothetical protein KIY83_gp82 [Mycobacterium phage Fameo]YP_010063892.1 hypothetical protein KIY84_gp85 [Mycobacterium phage Georgie2]AIS73847.1 hypothetical protein PBI_POWER_84 [Mycobacterium phage Power]ATN91929.1 hypothetical protein SEA_SNAPTAP_84 [Mycobacterium phage SnapTap]AXC33225.1 hypothetical protein SEA_CRUCIO_84 [Mycobacterium phage Crucio]AXQ53010.1 hypothetical protein SEA_QUEENBEESLY_84